MEQKKLARLNIDQARKRIGCSRPHVYRLLAEGKIKGYRFGVRRGIRIYGDSIEKFMQGLDENE